MLISERLRDKEVTCKQTLEKWLQHGKQANRRGFCRHSSLASVYDHLKGIGLEKMQDVRLQSSKKEEYRMFMAPKVINNYIHYPLHTDRISTLWSQKWGGKRTEKEYKNTIKTNKLVPGPSLYMQQ